MLAATRPAWCPEGRLTYSTIHFDRIVLITVSVAALLVPSLGEAAPPRDTSQARFPCLSRSQVERIRVAPATITSTYFRCRRDLRAALQDARIPTSVVNQQALLATVVSNRFAPYGSWDARTYEEFAAAPTLQCGSYAALTAILLRYMNPAPVTHLAFSASSPVGNHAQLAVGDLLLDPSIASIARISLPRLLAGVRTNRIVDGGEWRYPPTWYDFEDWVHGALRNGTYRSEHLVQSWTD